MLSDRGLLQRIFQNLLRNALRHTPPGRKIVVHVDRSDPSQPTVTVQDDGPGIPPDVQAILFEPFGGAALRAKGVRVDTGLGLASCKAAARALGGDVTVKSNGTRGSVFTVSLPQT